MSSSLVEQSTKYPFVNQDLLLQALTHTSYAYENLQDRSTGGDNERLEFLGDAVLDVVISDILLEVFPNSNEGHLSKMRAAVVNEKTLAEMAKSIHLHEVLRLGKGEIQTGGQLKPSILSGALEALIAAIYLDGGFNAVYPVVRHLFRPLFAFDRHHLAFCDHKTQLQEMVQAKWKVTPSYHLLQTSGPDHLKVFEVEVRMNGKTLASAMGNSKKEAEQNAAALALGADV